MPPAATPTTPRAFLEAARRGVVFLTKAEVFDRHSLVRELAREGLIGIFGCEQIEDYHAVATGKGLITLKALGAIDARLGWAEAPRGAGE